MIEFKSKVEITGKVVDVSTEEDLSNRGYGYMRILFKDNKKIKFINLYFWDENKELIANIAPVKNDIVRVSGYLDMRDVPDKKLLVSVSCDTLQILEKSDKINVDSKKY